MFLIDFHHTPQQAFFHGFLKGLSAPVMLFHAEPAPGVPPIGSVMLSTVSPGQSLADDWRRIGADLSAVISRHGEGADEPTG